MIAAAWLMLSSLMYSLQLNAGSFPKPLSREEEQHYLALASQGDLEARNILIERNLRLEAGKVKLSRDDFSLITLTKSIFEKLEMVTQAKELQVEFSFPKEFIITADEGRIAQVIENFVTNAIKYSPVGGRIHVQIQTSRRGTTFRIENDSAPLSEEALSKVWDTFYRTDEARSGGGTGLGLAIAKNIIELHGGKCSVCNTQSGVAFTFTI